MAKLWNAMDADGWEKYDAFVSLIKDTLAPLNPQENEKAHEIEDKVNAFMSTMFDELEQEYAYE